MKWNIQIIEIPIDLEKLKDIILKLKVVNKILKKKIAKDKSIYTHWATVSNTEYI